MKESPYGVGVYLIQHTGLPDNGNKYSGNCQMTPTSKYLLDQLSEGAKIHLIRGGFDIRKITGLSNRSKGMILEEQMGL